MSDIYMRTRLLIGDGVDCLAKKTVAVFGLGGVGSYAVEAFARAGVGRLILVDNDIVNESNINRQLFALKSTVGKLKTEVAFERINDINSNIKIITYPLFFNEKTIADFDFQAIDYFVDCIDSVRSKVLLIKTAKLLNKPVISCLSTGNKLNNTAFKIADIYQTSVCPLAKLLRHELKKEGVLSLKTVYSEETPLKQVNGRDIPSISFVPPVAGLIIAGEVIKDLLKE